MNTVYDLFLNFQDVAFEFFEWSKQDTIEHVKKIPMIRISEKAMLDFFNQQIQIPQFFLESIYNMTEKYDLTKLEYACLFSDGKMTLAVEFDKDGESIYKSRLLLEDEDEINKYALHEKELELDYQVMDQEKKQTFFTRQERKVKNFLEREIVKTFQNQEQSKMQYLYLEYFDEVEKDLDVIKKRLLESMKYSLNKKHFDLYELLLLLSKKKKV